MACRTEPGGCPLTAATDCPIDVDQQATWPETTFRWAHDQAKRLSGSTKFLADLAIPLEQEDEFRETFGGRKLLAYHCTRLLTHEAEGIRSAGLRVLDQQLVQVRIAEAMAHGELPAAARSRAETGNVYEIGNEEGRTGQVSLIFGRRVFDDDPSGCVPLLTQWGGEAMRGGPGDAPELKSVGRPAIVVAQLDIGRRHDDPYTFPPLSKLFVGSVLGLGEQIAETHYRRPIPREDILGVWQPGHPEYDRHTRLPRETPPLRYCRKGD